MMSSLIWSAFYCFIVRLNVVEYFYYWKSKSSSCDLVIGMCLAVNDAEVKDGRGRLSYELGFGCHLQLFFDGEYLSVHLVAVWIVNCGYLTWF